MITIPDRSISILVLTPSGRDAEIAKALLAEAGLASQSVIDLPNLLGRIGEDTGFVVLTEEALRSADLRPLAAWIRSQPSWSDMPFIVFTQRGGGPERNPAAARLLEVLGNVSFLERPFHATTFVSVAHTAIRGRRRQYEARLRIEALDEGERLLQTALQAGRLGSWELDLATHALTTSPTCRGIFGRQADDQFAFEDLLSAIHAQDFDRVKTAFAATIDTGVDFSIEYRTIWPDGSLHWAEIRAQLYRNRDGKAVKLVGVSADITDRRNAEDQQKKLNEILEERVAARTAELEAAHAAVMAEVAQREKAEEQLRQAQKLEAIGQLTGGVAHDFNNLLMAVLGNLELIRKNVGDNPRMLRLIEGAVQGAQRGASLTQRLLAFARRQDLQVKSVDLRALIAGMEELLTRSIGPMVSLRRKMPENLPLVLADANQVELALLNLAVNSRDAMPEGGSLTVALREETVDDPGSDLEPGRYVVLSVTDTGCGMDSDTLGKAVEPFFSTKELGKGTGLGLSMIHGLALQLRGHFRLKSWPGAGTTAELFIPVAPAADEGAHQPPPQPIEVPTDRGPKRILLVDDDILIAMSSADMVTDLGHEVVEVHSGAEAMQVLQDGQDFDLMITDFSMPGMNGADLTKAAREIRPDLPVLLATGYADLPNGMKVDAYRLSKPYSQDQLALEIAKALSA
ncbi:hybrid sensor histidine kinase/response regulator [Rhizobium grahamii]|uniref:histidine kinase n=1 Tax=Rhizobium grahamii CCGE 502 TaxID=990285 RepID=S3HDQ8_9HYPH|nr:hybrid sensor histidine kinase/response regulator [Rhizobium grahamii]EPE96864.1 two component sensor kinase/response regulator hybrid [Rhizobium grahamii CCGE 502]